MKTLIKLTLSILLTGLMAAQIFAAAGETENVREITVKGTDNMKFDVTLIEAEPGEKLRVTLVVESNLPKAAMGHNIAIVDQGVNMDDFVFASMTAKDNEYIAPAFQDQVIAFTKMIGGGETDTIEFTVPDTPGEYEYVCTFPGHYFGGMKGILRVTNPA
ncbi:plastocyanin/azurin family copper-binding protein [Rhodohalobacter mucosus]|uniref:Azurin n=1 Tax=Rhodohalobacter mucosus TaxID=2079485 RepID=A0A316TYT8_9BACT|nr:plastocyanin/azurin family copper-binding protein [Rhodohalobacter mucosus]PWN07994.1 azurin [Rhodohalobacter mucosus]